MNNTNPKTWSRSDGIAALAVLISIIVPLLQHYSSIEANRMQDAQIRRALELAEEITKREANKEKDGVYIAAKYHKWEWDNENKKPVWPDDHGFFSLFNAGTESVVDVIVWWDFDTSEGYLIEEGKPVPPSQPVHLRPNSVPAGGTLYHYDSPIQLRLLFTANNPLKEMHGKLRIEGVDHLGNQFETRYDFNAQSVVEGDKRFVFVTFNRPWE